MNDFAVPCSIEVEDVFGPVVASSCAQGFDFTLYFEEGILTILPLSIACK
jgi:ATP-binding cassette subfamily C (CFTR/MRP) protein 1